MNAKISKFLNRVELNGRIYYYNSLTNAIVELSSYEYEKKMLREIQIIEKGNVKIDNKNKYVKLGFVVNQNLDESKIIEYAYQKSKFGKSILRLDFSLLISVI